MPDWCRVLMFTLILSLNLAGECVKDLDKGRMFLAMAIGITAALTILPID